MRVKYLLIALPILALAACDSGSSNLVNDDGGSPGGPDAHIDGDGSIIADDGGVVHNPDSGPPPGCTPGLTQCSDCIDNDGDGLIDGFDPECTGGADNDEGSFATGIPGDNIDAKTQDCFFDGNSGGGDDKCAYHTCCLTDVNRDGTCPPNLQPPNYDPATCTASQDCINNCRPLVPPGCDCFGCCTICDGAGCRDVAINPAISPNCSLETLHDTTACTACVKSTECTGIPCGGDTCTLCPGQTQIDLPSTCGGTTQCPGSTTCAQSTDCNAGDYCSAGCCIHQIG